jgi:hypothetical protein
LVTRPLGEESEDDVSEDAVVGGAFALGIGGKGVARGEKEKGEGKGEGKGCLRQPPKEYRDYFFQTWHGFGVTEKF